MRILHRYILGNLLRNLAVSLFAFVSLFLVIDFFDRIDNIVPEEASIWLVVSYFLLKIPLIVSLMLPVSIIVATLFTVGLLSKNSEMTAMRAAGLKVNWLAKPILITGLVLSGTSILLNETLVPYCTRRVREIYNIDIRKKNESGLYNQSDFWWRSKNSFFSVKMFDSRNNTLMDLIRLDLDKRFEVQRRVNAETASFLTENLGWSMKKVVEYHFDKDQVAVIPVKGSVPLTIPEVPRDFYDVKTDPQTMSFRELRKFIEKLASNGISTREYLADLYEKFASPFLCFIVVPVVLPFALKPARSGSLAGSFIAALVIGFTYYAVHSLSLALGRADIFPPMLAAWMANIVMGCVALTLSLGAEAP